jgi:sugar (pentulose or hexulose) kinase
MGTWAVTSGIAKGCATTKRTLVYGRYVNDGQYIVHEASPTSSGNLEWLTAQWGDIALRSISRRQPAESRQRCLLLAFPLRQQRRAGDDQRLLRHAGAAYPRAPAAGGL